MGGEKPEGAEQVGFCASKACAPLKRDEKFTKFGKNYRRKAHGHFLNLPHTMSDPEHADCRDAAAFPPNGVLKQGRTAPSCWHAFRINPDVTSSVLSPCAR